MRRVLMVLFLVVGFSAFAVAAEAGAEVEAPSVLQQILTAVIAAAVTAVSSVLTVLLKRWASKVKAEDKEGLKYQAKLALVRMAENIGEKELKELKAAAADGKVTKDELKELGRKAIEDVKQEFMDQGVDVVKELGMKFLESQLRNVVDRLNKKAEVVEG